MIQLDDASIDDIMASIASFMRKVLKHSPKTSFVMSTACTFPCFSNS